MAKNKGKREAFRARREAREEQEGKKVVNVIFGVLIALALAFTLYATVIMQ